MYIEANIWNLEVSHMSQTIEIVLVAICAAVQ